MNSKKFRQQALKAFEMLKIREALVDFSKMGRFSYVRIYEEIVVGDYF